MQINPYNKENENNEDDNKNNTLRSHTKVDTELIKLNQRVIQSKQSRQLSAAFIITYCKSCIFWSEEPKELKVLFPISSNHLSHKRLLPTIKLMVIKNTK